MDGSTVDVALNGVDMAADAVGSACTCGTPVACPESATPALDASEAEETVVAAESAGTPVVVSGSPATGRAYSTASVLLPTLSPSSSALTRAASWADGNCTNAHPRCRCATMITNSALLTAGKQRTIFPVADRRRTECAPKCLNSSSSAALDSTSGRCLTSSTDVGLSGGARSITPCTLLWPATVPEQMACWPRSPHRLCGVRVKLVVHLLRDWQVCALCEHDWATLCIPANRMTA